MSKVIAESTRGADLKRINVQQRTFVQELLKDEKFRPTEAARKAGYKFPAQSANKLMNDPVVAAHIGKELYQRSLRANITADDVVKALANIGFFDIRKCFEDDGTLKNIVDIDEQTAAAIESIEVTTKTDDYGSVISTARLKFHSKIAALELIAKHLGMLNDKLNKETNVNVSVNLLGQLLGQVERKKSVIDADSILLEAEKT